MTLSTSQLNTTEIFYPDSDSTPMAESDPARDYLIYGVESLSHYQLIAANLLPNNVVSIYSEVLGLELRLLEGELRFYDPQTEKRLLSHLETEQARQQAEQVLQDAIPRLIELGLSVEQVAAALGLPVQEVRQQA